MKILGLKTAAAMAVAASILSAVFVAQVARSDSCSDYIIRMCNLDCAGVKPFYPCFKQCLHHQTCPPTADAGVGRLDPAVPGDSHKSTALKSDHMKLKD